MTDQHKFASELPEEEWGDPTNGREGAYVDPGKREFHCSNGQVWKISNRQFNPLVVMQIQAKGRPDVPKVEVTLLGKHKQLQDNPNDPAYKAAVQQWQAEANARVMQYIFCTGINAGDIPDEFISEYLEFVPNATASEIKYAYITGLTPMDDINALMNAIMGETEPTEDGMQTAAASFPGNS